MIVHLPVNVDQEYHANIAITAIHRMTVPILFKVGHNDSINQSLDTK